MHQSSLENMLAFRERYLEGRKDEPLFILDLGSLDVNGSYRGHFDAFRWTYRGIDMAAGKMGAGTEEIGNRVRDKILAAG